MDKILSRFFASTLLKLRRSLRDLLEPDEALPPDGEINAVLIHAFSLGSVLAFRRIYERFAPAIYRVLIRYFRSEQVAEDVVTKVFSALWFRREKFSEAEEVSLFLATKARSEAIKFIEKITTGTSDTSSH
jgi:hypothetical protein